MMKLHLLSFLAGAVTTDLDIIMSILRRSTAPSVVELYIDKGAVLGQISKHGFSIRTFISRSGGHFY